MPDVGALLPELVAFLYGGHLTAYKVGSNTFDVFGKMVPLRWRISFARVAPEEPGTREFIVVNDDIDRCS